MKIVRSQTEVIHDILNVCPDMMHKISQRANTNCQNVLRLVENGLLEKRKVDSDGWSENRKRVYLYYPTEKGVKFLKSLEGAKT